MKLCRSPSPRRKRRERSPIPRPTKIHIGHLTRNVTKEHVTEIFSAYGQIKMVDFATDKLHPNQGRGFAYVEFETADEAENAMKHMDGGGCDSPFCIEFVRVSYSPVFVWIAGTFVSFVYRTNRRSRDHSCSSIIAEAASVADAAHVPRYGETRATAMGRRRQKYTAALSQTLAAYESP